ncbi:MAG: DUF1894 domain-containing protein [Methanomicrobiales archaeon]|nr:DUF1894 domain-containing protein [Methanomicrobiales archaeon]MDI6877485.1 DUF1894 domain-containing protein [Methanomicrobiales archaeon]
MADRCVNKLGGRIVLSDATPEQVNEYVRRRCREYYEVTPGFEFRNISLLLRAPMLLGVQVKRKKILLPFTKVCLGTFLYEIPAEEGDLDYIRSRLGERAN